MFQSPHSAKLALLTLLLVERCFYRLRGRPRPGPSPSSAPRRTGFAIASLRPALANVQNTIANLNVGHWKAPGETRSAVQQDIVSMQRDLNTTLPGLMAQAEARIRPHSHRLSPSFVIWMPSMTCCFGSRKRRRWPAPGPMPAAWKMPAPGSKTAGPNSAPGYSSP